MKKENALKVIIVSLLCPVFYFVLPTLVNLIYQLIYGVIHATERQTDYNAFVENTRAAVAANSLYFLLGAIVLFLAIMFLVFKVRKKNLLERIQWNPVPYPVYGLVAIAVVASLISANALLNVILPDNVLEEVVSYTDNITSEGFLLTILLGVLLGPIVEETIYRGFMMARLQMRFPVWFAVALSALFFSAGHYTGGIGQLIGTAWGGVFFSLVFLWTKSLRASILAHIINNAVAFLIPDTVYAGMSLPVKLILFVVALAVTVFVLSLIYKRRDKGNLTVVE